LPIINENLKFYWKPIFAQIFKANNTIIKEWESMGKFYRYCITYFIFLALKKTSAKTILCYKVEILREPKIIYWILNYSDYQKNHSLVMDFLIRLEKYTLDHILLNYLLSFCQCFSNIPTCRYTQAFFSPAFVSYIAFTNTLRVAWFYLWILHINSFSLSLPLSVTIFWNIFDWKNTFLKQLCL